MASKIDGQHLCLGCQADQNHLELKESKPLLIQMVNYFFHALQSNAVPSVPGNKGGEKVLLKGIHVKEGSPRAVELRVITKASVNREDFDRLIQVALSLCEKQFPIGSFLLFTTGGPALKRGLQHRTILITQRELF